MANEEHVEIVKQGEHAINAFREKNPNVRLDLNEADLREANLNRADLSGARLLMANLIGTSLIGTDLSGADLSQADLLNADLHTADLSETNLDEANLRQANLIGAVLIKADLKEAILNKAGLLMANLFRSNLSGVDLSDANLNSVDLSGANLVKSNLCGASLAGARLLGTVFADVDLSTAKNLSEVMHLGPSTIGIDTLYKSKGKIPDVFLRGCGVPEDFITFVPSHIAGSPVQFDSCFISYSHANEEFAQRLHSRMQQEKLRVWYAPEDRKGGEYLHEQIERAIQSHDRLLLVLSKESMESEWVKLEIRKALSREKKEKRRILYPIRLVPFDSIKEREWFDGNLGRDLSEEICKYFIPDFTTWKEHDAFEESFTGLLRDLRKSEAKADSPEP